MELSGTREWPGGSRTSELHKEEDAYIVFLFETKIDRSRILGFRWKLGMMNMVAKDLRWEGLAIFWKRGVKLTRLYVDAEVEENDGFVWMLAGMYGDRQ